MQDRLARNLVLQSETRAHLIAGYECTHPVPSRAEVDGQFWRRAPFVLHVESQQPRDLMVVIDDRDRSRAALHPVFCGEGLRMVIQLDGLAAEIEPASQRVM